MPTEWELFRERWKGGCGSSLCSNAKHVCLARGRIPSDILFVGEAPPSRQTWWAKFSLGRSG